LVAGARSDFQNLFLLLRIYQFDKLSIITTSKLFSIRLTTVCEPMYPKPPVTKIFFIRSQFFELPNNLFDILLLFLGI
jgi:hypothetical protein